MDNEEDYIELHRLLAKCKFNLVKEQFELCNAKADSNKIVNYINDTSFTDYYEKKIKQIDEFIVDIPIIIKGDEK